MNRKLLCKLAAAAWCVVLLANGRADAATPISACGVTITTPGAYVVTTNLTNSGSTPCITVNASEVRIDLGGYVIASNGLTTPGVYSNYKDLSVSNGTITGFSVGIQAAYEVRLAGLNVVGNTLYGAHLQDSARVTGCQFRGNGRAAFGGNGRGLLAADRAMIRDSVFAGNGGTGAVVLSGALVTHSAFAVHTQWGLSTGVGASVTESTFDTNQGMETSGGAALEDDAGYNVAGFDSGTPSTYRGNSANGFSVNSATFMGNSASRSGSDGFRDSGFSTYLANTADNNYGDAFHGGNIGSTYTGNTSDSGFFVVCPDNLIGNTGSFASSGSGCNLVNNLGF